MKYKNSILLDLFEGKKTTRPPVWVMRQAGRILPGYRKIRKEAGSFKKLVKSPDLISEVTVEPLHKLGVDAAILFSDILVIPEAMGLNYEIVEKTGPIFEKTIQSRGDIDALIDGEATLEHLTYVFDSIDSTKERLNGSNPLIGFSGAPWTLFAYMLEGKGSKTFSVARRFIYENPKESHLLLQKITNSIIFYLKEKINKGVDVVQLFDSWADMLPPAVYNEFGLRYAKQVFDEIKGTPKIFFPKGSWSSYQHMNDIDFDAVSIDWKTPPDYVRSQIGDVILQGNLDPALLYAPISDIEVEVKRISAEMGTRHIFNLGHGVYPDTNAEHVKGFIDAVKSIRF